MNQLSIRFKLRNKSITAAFLTLRITEAETFCRCNSDSYGPNCNLNLTQFEDKYKDGCKNGIFEPKNTITGCSCREPREGNATEYHGWYCEIPNR